jgi:GNAT superfamily N-acetyltransferase
MAEYRFATTWRIKAPLQVVWDTLYHPDIWATWWKSLIQVVEVTKGDELGIGALHRYTWKGILPYRITFDIRILNIVPLQLLEGQASGEVEGNGQWRFSYDGTYTIARYIWHIRTKRLWMNCLAPVAAPLFRWNHDAVMRQGAKGLAQKLGTSVEMAPYSVNKQRGDAMQIRRYQEADRPFLRTLYLAARKAAFTWRDTGHYRLEDFDRSTLGEEIWVAEKDGKLLGFVSIYSADNFIHNLYVDPHLSPQGVGTALLHAAEHTFTSTGSLKCLVKNQKALAFYHKHGWQTISTGCDGNEEYYLLHFPKK